MSGLSLEEKQEALKQAGYRIAEWSATNSAWRSPDGYDFEFAHASTPDIIRVVNFAYQHYQEKQELEALRGFVQELGVNSWDKHLNNGYPNLHRAANAIDWARGKAKELIEKYKKD